ncbi:AAEL004373-PA, partial [Aedes aegypti]
RIGKRQEISIYDKRTEIVSQPWKTTKLYIREPCPVQDELATAIVEPPFVTIVQPPPPLPSATSTACQPAATFINHCKKC